MCRRQVTEEKLKPLQLSLRFNVIEGAHMYGPEWTSANGCKHLSYMSNLILYNNLHRVAFMKYCSYSSKNVLEQQIPESHAHLWLI